MLITSLTQLTLLCAKKHVSLQSNKVYTGYCQKKLYFLFCFIDKQDVLEKCHALQGVVMSRGIVCVQYDQG